MGLFKEVYCKHCGAKIGLFTRNWLSDGNCVCNKCASPIPGYVREGLSKWTYQDFTEVLRYVEYSKNVIAPVFRGNHFFQGLELDTVHGWFCVDDKLFGNKLYFQLEDVESIDLEFLPEEFKEGMLSDKVKGNVQMSLKMYFPEFKLDKTVGYGVKAGAELKVGIFSNKVSYSNPKGMDEFIAAFMDAHGTFLYGDKSERFCNKF